MGNKKEKKQSKVEREAKPVGFEWQANDVVLRPVPFDYEADEPVAFHMYNPNTNVIVGHVKWTKKGNLTGKHLKHLFEKTDEE